MPIEIVKPSVGLSKIATSETHGEDSPYFAGWKAYDENPYHETQNPSGVIQMGLAENQVSTHTTFHTYINKGFLFSFFIFFIFLCVIGVS